ncbi:hypothetical protein ABBQ32_000937, partial [Trebouxia sp. C0010 RCD-2024]
TSARLRHIAPIETCHGQSKREEQRQRKGQQRGLGRIGRATRVSHVSAQSDFSSRIDHLPTPSEGVEMTKRLRVMRQRAATGPVSPIRDLNEPLRVNSSPDDRRSQARNNPQGTKDRMCLL